MATKADIKSATITYMKLSKTDTKYKITAQWDIELTTGIAEKLYMMVFHQSGTKYTKEISLDATDGEIEFTPAVEDDTYKFTISDRPTTYNKDICTPVSVLFRTYENVSGEYDGDMVQLKWDKPNKEIVVGESLVKTLPDDYTVPVIGGKIERYYRETSFKVSGQNYNDGSAFQIELEPAKSTVSCGITVRSGLFFHKPVEIHIVNIDDVSDGLEITATFKTAYLGSTWKTYVDSGEIMIQPVLWLNDGSLLNGTKTALKDLMETEDTATHKFTVTDKVWVKNINSCDDIKMTLNLCTSTTRTVIRTRENTMLLTRPSVRFAYTDKNAITVSWDYQRNDNFTVKVDSKSYTSTDKSLDIKDITLSTLLDSDITVEPHKTPKSCAIKLFKSGFYPSASGVEYFESAYTGDNLNIKLGADFFETDPSAKLMEGPFTIEDGVFSYDKSIQFTKEHFSKWLELLDENSISPSGYYEMRRIVSSIHAVTNENILYAYAGITQGERVSDIIPGTALYIETAAYQFPTGDSKNNHGMSHNSNELYNVALKPCGESKVLSFDSYMNEIMPSWLPFNGGGGKRVQWAGAIDFFFKTVRLPYARLVLPESYMLSDSRDSASNADNAIILLCDDIKQLNATAKILTETPAAEISIPNILLRGRAGVRLTHSIMYNSCVTNVPIGTRLFEIIPAFSPFKNQNIRFMRQTPFGLRCVHTKLFDEATLSQMLLMAGDIIEVL